MTTEAHNLDHSAAGTILRHQPIHRAGQRQPSGNLGGRHRDIPRFSHKLMAFFLVAGLSADMGIYRDSTLIRGCLFYFIGVRKRKVCHVLAIHFRLKRSIDRDIYFVRGFRHYNVLRSTRWQIQGKRFLFFTEQALSRASVLQKGVR